MGDVIAQYSRANATYNSLQAMLQYRFAHGLVGTGELHLAKALVLADGGVTVPVRTPTPRAAATGRRTSTGRRCSASYIYELPIGKGARRCREVIPDQVNLRDQARSALSQPGPLVCDIHLAPDEIPAPRVSSVQRPDPMPFGSKFLPTP